jgi:hypothetical protein
MNTELTAFDLKFLSECGIPVDDEQRADKEKETDSKPHNERNEDAEYYRRIIQDLG